MPRRLLLGDNFYGQLGDVTAQNTSTTPVAVVGIGGAVQEITTGTVSVAA
jgi:hypothetical protein